MTLKLLTTICLIAVSQFVYAQVEQETNIKIVEKVIDENGEVQEKVTEMRGEEARKYLEGNNMQDALKLDEQTAEEIKKEIKISINTEAEGKEQKNYKVKFIEDGEVSEFEWNGEGEMPQEMKALMEENDLVLDEEISEEGRRVTIKTNEEVEEIEKEIELEIEADETTRATKAARTYKLRINENGQEKEYEWNGEGEMPQEMKEILEKHDVEFEQKVDGGSEQITITSDDPDIEWRQRGKDKTKAKAKSDSRGVDPDWHMNHREFGRSNNNKARRGVAIEEAGGYVVVKNVIVGSAAEKAGIGAGDIILNVEGTNIDSTERLVSEMGTHNPGDIIKVELLIGGKKKKIKVQL